MFKGSASYAGTSRKVSLLLSVSFEDLKGFNESQKECYSSSPSYCGYSYSPSYCGYSDSAGAALSVLLALEANGFNESQNEGPDSPSDSSSDSDDSPSAATNASASPAASPSASPSTCSGSAYCYYYPS